MNVQDVADDQLFPQFARHGDHALTICQRIGHRFFQKHMRARLHRGDGVIGVRLRIRADAHRVGPSLGQRLAIIRKLRVTPAQLRAQLPPRSLAAAHQPDDLEVR